MFSIIITTFDRDQLVKQCIGKSLANMGVKRDEIELIWVDDGSTDNVREVMKEFNPDISILKSKNEGLIKSYNQGFRLARGGWIVRLGSDIEMPEGWLLKIKEITEKIHTGVAGIMIRELESFVYNKPEYISEEKEIDGIKVLETKKIMGIYAFSREVLNKVGYLDEEFGYYGPVDREWAARVQKAGFKSYYIKELKCRHLGVGKWDQETRGKKDAGLKYSWDNNLLEKKVTSDRIYYNPYI